MYKNDFVQLNDLYMYCEYSDLCLHTVYINRQFPFELKIYKALFGDQ